MLVGSCVAHKMVYLRGLMMVCSMAISASNQFHLPLVYEDSIEYNSNENVRTARNSDTTYKTVHHPYIFKFATAKQQDHQKFRYAQQQKIALINGISKSHRFLGQSQKINFKSVPRVQEQDATGWQPFDPKLSKQNTKDTLLHFKSVDDVKFYKSGAVKVAPPRNDRIQSPNPSYERNDDLETEASENIEKKIDVGDSSNEFNKLILVRSNQLQEHPEPNSDEKLNLENQNISIKKPDGQLTALNDLIGKNPNVQLEGLQRLLQNIPTTNYNIPSSQGGEQFQSREQQDTVNIPNAHLVPNIQVKQDNTITVQTPHAIDKDSFENIQKQLDEASKIQVQQVLARAQQEAQAHVDAQHKAIALAQVQARQVALDNLKKSLFSNSQALSLTQTNEGEEYHDITPVQHQSPQAEGYHDVQPQALPLQAHHNRPIISYSNVVQTQEHPLTNTLEDNISLKKSISHPGSKQHIPAQAYGSKELLYYAPNHNHQAAAQLQAEKAILAQVRAQNSVILQSHRGSPSALRKILKAEQVRYAEREEASDIHSVTESQPQPTAYQHIVLESKEEEDAAEEQTDYDDHDDYAAKYAFGYRIKDAKEGNDFGHEERRNGKNLEGSYHVLLPDGRLQKVEYYADKSGYHAKVTYEHTNIE